MLLAGYMPEPSFLVSKEPRHLFAVQDFCGKMQELNAKPKVHIAYYREAYVPHDDNSARLTMDRAVRSEPDLSGSLTTKMNRPSLIWGKDIVLELKFTNRFPDWFRDLVRAFNLMQCGAAKYVDGVALQGEHTLGPAAANFQFDPAWAGSGNGDSHPARREPASNPGHHQPTVR